MQPFRSYSLDFLDLGSLALTLTQVVELCSAHLTVPDHINMVDAGRVDRESTLDADAVGNAANGKRLADTAVPLRNHGAFERLKTFAVAFNNLDPDAYGITDTESRKIAANLLRLD